MEITGWLLMLAMYMNCSTAPFGWRFMKTNLKKGMEMEHKHINRLFTKCNCMIWIKYIAPEKEIRCNYFPFHSSLIGFISCPKDNQCSKIWKFKLSDDIYDLMWSAVALAITMSKFYLDTFFVQPSCYILGFCIKRRSLLVICLKYCSVITMYDCEF